MSDSDSKAELSAERAYADAAAAVPAKEPEQSPVVEQAPAIAESQPVAPAKPAVAKKTTPAKRAAAKPVRKAKAVRKPAAAKPAARAKAPARPAAKIQIASQTVTTLKEKIMPKNAKIAEGIKEVVADAQAKAKKAVDKGTSLFGEASEFTKGNVEAMVESGKILATGLQAMGKDFVVEGRTAFETVTGDVKQIASVKSPTELLKVQSEITRKNLDAAIALGSKNSEAMLKLASDVLAPISGRFSLAAEKVRKIAA